MSPDQLSALAENATTPLICMSMMYLFLQRVVIQLDKMGETLIELRDSVRELKLK